MSKPDQTSTSRKLAAIMFSDIVGYTALMGKDEDRAFQVLRKNREIHKAALENHNGQLLKELGDGILASFGAVTDAVYCALEIQQKASQEPDFSLKVGIHLGEVVFEGGDVHGDGVNIASRLSDVAKDGHILISEAVYKNVANKKGINTQFIDKMTLKNVAEPVDIYMIDMGSVIEDPGSSNEIRGSFWSEVKRRNVIRALISYLFLGILISLVADMAFPIWNFPGWAFPALEVLLITGLPIAIILAWLFERSPEGIVRTSSKKSWQNPYTTEQRKPLTSNSIILSIILITSFVYGYPRLFSGSDSVPTAKEIKRFNILFPEEAPLALLGESVGQFSSSSLALSPDGRMLVYSGWRNGRSQLHVRYLDKMEVIPIEGTEGAYNPFFSPDGKWVAFATQTKIRKVMVPDGSPVDIAPVNIQYGAVWTTQDEIIYSTASAIWKVSSRGGIPTSLYTRKVNNVISGYNSSIDITPDLKNILFSDLDGDIFALNLETGNEQIIYPRGGGAPKSLPSGHLIFSRNNSLFGVPFDFKTLSPLGQENQIISGIRTERSGPQLTSSNDGLAIHIPGYYYQRSAFVWLSKDGERQTIEFDPDNYGSFDLSPDGKYLAISMLPAQDHIKVLEFNTGQVIRVKVEKAEMLYSPVWAPDSKSIIFGAQTNGSWSLYRKNIMEVRDAEELYISDVAEWPYSLSEDGNYINVNSKIIKIDPKSLSTKDIEEIAGGNHMAISPDNAFTVYASEESGESQIYVQPFPATGEKWQISTDGGTDPIWSKDGIYFHNDVRIYFVTVHSFKTFEYGTPEVFYNGAFMNAVSRSLGIDKEGRILILEPASGSQLAREAIVTINWFEEVKRLAPVSE